ncbi:SDR family oxidoreductase [Roseibium sp.]|uniref:SDR family oxidoreductase n=2 Tax=Roseibium sp. TaxID=1936156 RepID=UPI00326419EB
MFDLTGQKALVVGVANDQSIAWGCAKALKAQGAEIIAPLDVRSEADADALFGQITERWGKLDTLVHSIAFSLKDDLHGRVVDCSAEGFGLAMDISVHSFLRLIRRAEPLMPNGGTCMTVSFMGAQRVVEHYNIMGPVKAALEAATRYAAAELGPKGISVHALSPGPLQTRAASGIDAFDTLLNDAAERAPTHHLATIEDVGAYAAFLASREAANVTGGIHPIDGGYSIIG